MNYYRRHIGDYLRDASHLSLLEHGVYTRLLDLYYIKEQPLPDSGVARLVCAHSDDERRAVDTVLSEFFVLADGQWRQARCDREIADYQAKAERNREVGRLGGRPKGSRLADGYADEPINNPDGFQSEPTANPDITLASSQEPIANKKKERETRSRGSRLPTDWLLPDDWAQWACRERPDIDCQRTAAGFADYWHGKAGSSAVKVDWEATWRNWVRNERPVVQAKTPADRRSQFMAGILEGSKRSEVVNVETYEPPAKRLG